MSTWAGAPVGGAVSLLEGVLPRAARMPPLAPRQVLLALVALLLLALGEMSVLPPLREG